MEQQLFQDYDPEKRKQLLEDNADEIVEKNYHRRFNSAERNLRRARNSEIDLEISDLDEDLKSYKEAIKNKRAPLVEEKKKLLEEIKSDGEYVKGTVYKRVDIEKREVGFYDPEGNLIEQRRMTSEDRTLFMKLRKTGTE